MRRFSFTLLFALLIFAITPRGVSPPAADDAATVSAIAGTEIALHVTPSDVLVTVFDGDVLALVAERTTEAWTAHRPWRHFLLSFDAPLEPSTSVRANVRYPLRR